MKKTWTHDKIRDTIAKSLRIPRREADDAVEAVKNCIESGGTMLDRWMEIMVSWGWYYNMDTKQAAKECARLMRAFGIKTPLKYTCSECGCKVEVKA